MTTFRRKPLDILERMYRFTSAVKAPPTVQLEQGITLVHDVSREVERTQMTLRGGYFYWQNDVTHAGIGTVDGYQSIYDAVMGGNLLIGEDLTREDIDVWMLDNVWVVSDDVSDINTGLNIGIAYNSANDGIPYHPNELFIPLYRAVGTSEYGNFGDYDATGTYQLPINTMTQVNLPKFPFLLFGGRNYGEGARLTWWSNAGAAVTHHIFFRGWVGRRGCTPPGMS